MTNRNGLKLESTNLGLIISCNHGIYWIILKQKLYLIFIVPKKRPYHLVTNVFFLNQPNIFSGLVEFN